MAAVLTWPDYLILVGLLAVSLAIGIYHSLTGGKQRTMEEFIMANRRLKVIPTAISLLVTFQSAITFLGLSAETYYFGIQYMIFAGIASIIIGLLAVERIIVPWLYPLKLVSMNEYLERRFQTKSVRIFGAVLGIISGIMYMGVAMYAPSAALESATGLSLKISVLLMALVTVTYTALGGMRAVIWTDVFQFVIMVGGFLAVLIKGLIAVGGISNMFEIAGKEGRLDWADINPDPRVRHTVWGILFGITMGWFSLYGLSQSSIQRFSAVDTLSKARSTVLINIVPLGLMNVLSCIFGLIALAYYSLAKCDPLANRDIKSPNQILSFFVVDLFSDSLGFAGLFMATLYGGALSTVSSGLSAAAANIWEDILQWKLAHLKETTKAMINRILVVILGIFAALIAIFCSSVPGTATQMMSSLTGSVTGPILGIFVTGGVSRHTNWKGCLIGGFVGLTFSLWMSLGSIIYGPKPTLLPLVSVEGCNIKSLNFTSEALYNCTSLSVPRNTTEVYQRFTQENTKYETLPKTDERSVLYNFYSLSYVWIRIFPAVVTIAVAFTTSIIMRDRELESKVEDRLLIRFRKCCTFTCQEEVLAKKDDQEVMQSFNKESEAQEKALPDSDVSVEGKGSLINVKTNDTEV